jgi:hypothetical protein
MNLIIVFGPPAAGKMTVGQELAKLTGYKLLHNHMTIDLVTELFDFGTPQFKRLVPAFRQMLVAEAAASDLKGLIFTFVWAFDFDGDKVFLDGLRDAAAAHGGDTYYVELECGLEERLIRNRTENRLRHKKKADFEKTEGAILRLQERCRMNSDGDFPYPDKHIKIDNSILSAGDAAERVATAFDL